MMTGTLGIVMWLMMGLMIAGLAGATITWAKRRLRRQTAQQPLPRRPEDNVRRRWLRRS